MHEAVRAFPDFGIAYIVILDFYKQRGVSAINIFRVSFWELSRLRCPIRFLKFLFWRKFDKLSGFQTD